MKLSYEDLPALLADGSFLQDTDVVLLLHDEGESGRIFRMPAW